MRPKTLASLFLWLTPAAFAQSRNPLIITTKTGTCTGLINGTAPGVRQFLNIPFAQLPTGPRRWLPPVPPTTDASTNLDATHFPKSCPQYLSGNPSVYNQDVPEFILDPSPYEPAAGAMPHSSAEDCLSLAIWSPTNASDTSSLPVIMFMTGGGFNNGGIDIKYQLPHNWVQRTQAHIVVTINYRLSILGFPDAAGLDSQNLAFLDQRMALEWVRDNIAAFGGDPQKITLWGQSAGAASIDVHNFAFRENVIAKGLYMMSGTAYLAEGGGDASHSNFSFVASKMDCGGDRNASETLACMRKVPAKKIVEFVGRYNDENNGSMPSLSFGPTPDGKVVFANYTQRYVDRSYSRAPAIVSNCADEGAGLTTYPENNRSAGPWQVAADRTTLSGFICPSHNTSVYRGQTESLTYRYQYAGNFSNVSPRGWMAAYHDSDLPMVMGTYNDFRALDKGPELDLQRRTSERMQDLVLAFMRAPMNAADQMGWSEFASGQILRLGGGDGRVARNVSVDTIDGACYGMGTYDSSP